VDEETFNMSVRKFLKKLGVTAQREIELAVREQVKAGELRGDETLEATATITVRGVSEDVVVTGTIALSWRSRPARSGDEARSGCAARLLAESHLDGAVVAVALHGHGNAIAGLAFQNGLGDVAGGVDARRRCGRWRRRRAGRRRWRASRAPPDGSPRRR
jgi:hypothetical protein